MSAGVALAVPGACVYCSSAYSAVVHGGMCPRVRAIEYYDSGVVKRVEFKDEPTDTVERRRELDALCVLIDAVVRRHRCVFSTSQVVVELAVDHVPAGPVTMLLGADDIRRLETLASRTAPGIFT